MIFKEITKILTPAARGQTKYKKGSKSRLVLVSLQLKVFKGDNPITKMSLSKIRKVWTQRAEFSGKNGLRIIYSQR